MNFRKATDELLAGISHQELAKALGVSVPSVRQARLDQAAKAYRRPRDGWEDAVMDLAMKRIGRLHRLYEVLQKQRQSN